MAAPNDMNIHNLSGKWALNRSLSDDISPVLALQGVNWIVRAALSRAPISLTISHVRNEASGVETVTTTQHSMGRVTQEERALDWTETTSSHPIFGQIVTKSRISALDDSKLKPFLCQNWEDNTSEVIEAQSVGPGWTSWQIWGFQVIDGKRYHVRNAIVQKGKDFTEAASEFVEFKMVYDRIGEM
ncbi:hypothetical protein B0T16DRAFT_411167 [Cercophora newfieldiana]|uniref:Uncharacterized protein n=1 Tax=Cercophora newfieldiana TaxID=92897 RepID=A0AA39Y6K2_9PEZI|nr:hypothetical protein B0T16DRAFT_411167 [Cercophora newfieldiana]